MWRAYTYMRVSLNECYRFGVHIMWMTIYGGLYLRCPTLEKLPCLHLHLYICIGRLLVIGCQRVAEFKLHNSDAAHAGRAVIVAASKEEIKLRFIRRVMIFDVPMVSNGKDQP